MFSFPHIIRQLWIALRETDHERVLRQRKALGYDADEEQLASTSPPAKAGEDPFLEGLSAFKKQTDSDIEKASSVYEQKLKSEFGEDVELRERLTRFTQEQELDTALIAFWNEVRHYAAWSKREDFRKWNKLNLTDVDGSKMGATEVISFVHSGQNFTVTAKTSRVFSSRLIELSVTESTDEMFSIQCSIEGEGDEEDGVFWDKYCFLKLAAFKKRGHWARMLLEMHRLIKTEQKKTSADYDYQGAEEIKTRFKE